MLKDWFNKRVEVDANQRTALIMVRIFGIDFSVMVTGWVSDWKLVDLRIPVNYGVYTQVLFLILAVGRMSTDTYEEE